MVSSVSADSAIEFRAGGPFMAVPVQHRAPHETVTLSWGEDSMALRIPLAWGPESAADFVADYPLPYPWEETTVRATEAFRQAVAWEQFPRESEEEPEDPYRPLHHFTSRRGWINDPNGLFYLDGTWHLFYQYSPFTVRCVTNDGTNNMHWGHAVSEDLVHWRSLGIALYPDALRGDPYGAMYSGSAVIDHENQSGLGKDTVMLFYSKKHVDGHWGTQNLAFSTDRGRTFRKYDGNPLVPYLGTGNDRDPAVTYDPEAKCWYMSFYRGVGDGSFYFLTSRNLLDWTLQGTYEFGRPPKPVRQCLVRDPETGKETWGLGNVDVFSEGYQQGMECPSIRRMRDAVTGAWTWVFTEANGFYRLARIQAGQVQFQTEPRPFLYGNNWAGQFFCNAPDNRQIYMAFMRRQWDLNPSSTHFCGVLTTPMEVTLENGRLKTRPAVSCGEPERWNLEGCAAKQLPDAPLVFDLPNHTVTYQNMRWLIPEHLTQLKGRAFRDQTILEFFDDSGDLAFCLTCHANCGQGTRRKHMPAEAGRNQPVIRRLPVMNGDLSSI